MLGHEATSDSHGDPQKSDYSQFVFLLVTKCRMQARLKNSNNKPTLTNQPEIR